VKLSSNVASLGQSDDTVNSNFEEEEPLESLEEIEAQTIGNLLPDDDDLLSGVIDGIGYIAQPNCGDDIDDDIFCTGGGMELEGDDNCINASDLVNRGGSNGLQGGLSSAFAGEHPYGEHPSRTLFVRNINSNVEDVELKMLFEVHILLTFVFGGNSFSQSICQYIQLKILCIHHHHLHISFFPSTWGHL